MVGSYVKNKRKKKLVNFRKWFEENGLITGGDYQIDVRFKHIKKTFETYIDEYKIELIPDFQRGHVWTDKQREAFVLFLLRGGRTTPIYLNHTHWGSGEDGWMVLVDGLQRLTAILKFLNNELKVKGLLYSDFDKVLGRCVYVKININSLKTRKDVLQWYLEINSGGTPHSKSEIERVKKLLEKEAN